ncbi:MAG: outer membrane protein [Aestuariivirgaceae bacterium]
MAAFRRSLTAALAACIFTSIGSVSGQADPTANPTLRDVHKSILDWDGAYAGALFSVKSFEAGSQGSGPAISMKDGKGRLAGIVAGYNFGHKSWLYGLEADIGYGQIKASQPGVRLKADVMGTLRARFGRRFQDSLFYATAGASFTGVNQRSPLMTSGDTSTHIGLVVGGGLEFALTRAISGRLEYVYGHTLEDRGLGIENLHMLRAGAVYHFSQ